MDPLMSWGSGTYPTFRYVDTVQPWRERASCGWMLAALESTRSTERAPLGVFSLA
jgi:hypothetical protein